MLQNIPHSNTFYISQWQSFFGWKLSCCEPSLSSNVKTIATNERFKSPSKGARVYFRQSRESQADFSSKQWREESLLGRNSERGDLLSPRSSSRCLESPVLRRPSWLGGASSAASGSLRFEAGQPRPAKSVEDMVDRRVSSLSTTSG